MNKHIFFIAIIISSLSFAAEKKAQFPEHLAKQCYTKPTKSYTCRDLTPEEVIQSNERRKEQEKKDKVEIVKSMVSEQYGAAALARVEKMSDNEIVGIYDKIVENFCARIERSS